MESIITTDNLTKIYRGSIKAVDSLTVQIRKGEVYGILGPNGAGKTTFIGMLTTRVTPTSGRATVAGLDIVKESLKVRKRIGVVPQDLTTDEDLTGYENLKLVSRFYDIPTNEANRRIDQLLNMVQLQKHSHRRVKTYSGGMRKRLELIVGLVNDPDILFLDEPTLGLDVNTRMQMWEYIRDLRKRLDVTIILTSHYLEEIDALADRVSIMDNGKILVTDTPLNLKNSMKEDYITITFASPDDLKIGEKFFSNNEKRFSGINTLRIKVPNSDETMPDLINYFSSHSVKITRITIQKPTLDEVFLEYTGRSLRDEEGGDARKSMFTIGRLRR